MNLVNMRIVRAVVVSLLIVGLSTPAAAGDLATSGAKAVQQQAAQVETQATQAVSTSIPRKYLWPGVVMLVGGLASGLYLFMNNQNGDFPGPDEYGATEKVAGGVALATAFAGGAVLYLGQRQSRNASVVTFAPGAVTVSNRVSW